MAPKPDPATKYARWAVRSRQVGRLVKLACQRHLDDLRTGKKRGLRWDAKAGERVVTFFRDFLKHSKGEWAGQPVELAPWQQFAVMSLFGWQRADGTRRFRTGYFEVAKKNGKSTLAAGVGLYLLVADGEAGSEVYAAATKRDQARIVWDEAKRMVQASPDLKDLVQVFRARSNLSIEQTASKFEPLGRDADSMDGLNVHAAILDELHVHGSREVHDVLKQSTAARRQPLVFEITTAGTDRNSICWEEREYSEKVLTGVIADDSFFAYVAALDDNDRWDDERVWAKANPNLGVSKKLDKMREECEAAKSTPAKQNAFRRYHLDEWTRAETRFLDLDRWDACAGDLMPLELERENEGRRAYGGLDLATTTDLAAFVLAFEPEDEEDWIDVLCRFWIPADRIPDRVVKDRVPYDLWEREGWVIATPGDVIDYRAIRDEITELGERYEIREIAFDRWGSQAISNDLSDAGFTMVQFGQGYASMSPATKEFEKAVLTRQLRHGGQPVLRWNADNLTVRTDPSGNVKPVKPGHKMSGKKIDGMVALIMALDRTIRHEGTAPESSVYTAERGLLTL